MKDFIEGFFAWISSTKGYGSYEEEEQKFAEQVKIKMSKSTLDARKIAYGLIALIDYKLMSREEVCERFDRLLNSLFPIVYSSSGYDSQKYYEFIMDMLYKVYIGEATDFGGLRRKVKVFLSLPFTGKEETLNERLLFAKARAIDEFTTNGTNVEILTQENIKELIQTEKSGENYPYYMGKDIEMILSSDAVVFGEGWRNSKGCSLEHHAAETFGIKCVNM